LQSLISFSIVTASPINQVNWNFGDPTSGANNSSSSLNPSHQFSEIGTYQITAIVEFDCYTDTISENITLFNEDISLESVMQAAQKVGIHDFIMSLPLGYDYNVKERGVMLSSGQRQLIAFLRAYVSNPSILILDEATSSIDTHSEELIQKATETILYLAELYTVRGIR
jgi:ABC-type transport system involved in Fe-S cluster assembly fused permease/ATPase subunit